MAGEAAAAIKTILLAQALLRDFESSFKFGAYLCPFDADINTVASNYFDYIIVGCGTAGSVLANRLSACPKVKVLVLEAGGCPPFEALFPSEVVYPPKSRYDFNLTSVNDNKTCQNLQGHRVPLTQGKLLGGCSSISHMIISGNPPHDYNERVKVTNNSFWSYDSFLPYVKKSESVKDKETISKYRSIFGAKGPIGYTKERRPENNGIFEAYQEIGYKKVVDASNNQTVIGVLDPLLQIDKKLRQSGLVSYISPVKNRPNLFFLTEATVTKIIFKNKVAIGVQFSYKNKSYSAYAKSEVILSAGTFRTPQLLILSGIGPSKDLKSLGIPVISDLPVGQNLQDHVAAILIFGMENSTLPTPAANPFMYPTPVTTNFGNLVNPNASFALYQGVTFLFPQNSPSVLPFFLNIFNFSVPICQKIYEANVNRSILLAAMYDIHPKSRGEMFASTTDIEDHPIVKLNYFTNPSDLENLAAFVDNTAALVNTTYFKSIGADIVDFGLCSKYPKYSFEYWKCYTREMSCTSWHFCCTASMGPVVDKNAFVKGVRNLRVVDSSMMPIAPGGNPIPIILGMAEKVSDIILKSNPLCVKRKRKPKRKCGCRT